MFELTAQQKANFDRDGFLVVERLIDEDTVEILRETFERLFKGEFETGVSPDEVNWQQSTGDPSLTRQICEWYFPTSELNEEQQEVIDFINVVREEDIPLCETVQKGLHSLGYSQGRFVANEARSYFSEHAVHDFQRRVLKSLF